MQCYVRAIALPQPPDFFTDLNSLFACRAKYQGPSLVILCTQSVQQANAKCRGFATAGFCLNRCHHFVIE